MRKRLELLRRKKYLLPLTQHLSNNSCLTNISIQQPSVYSVAFLSQRRNASRNRLATPSSSQPPYCLSSCKVQRDLYQLTISYVFCHFIVGNTYPYTVADWENDIAAARALGIDAFSLDMGLDNWQFDRITDAYTAAANVARANPNQTPFKLFLSFDLSFDFSYNQIITYLQKFSTNAYQFTYQGRPFVSTFSGETRTFGYPSVNAAWQAIKQNIANTKHVSLFFVPEWSAWDPATVFRDNPAIDGMFSWNAWYRSPT